MNTAPLVSISFLQKSESELAVRVAAIIAALSNNSNYKSPTPDIKTLQTGLANYNTALAAAENGGRKQTAAKNAARSQLVQYIRSLALYVQQNCGGSLAKLLTSGFDARKSPQRAGVLPPPELVTLRTNNVSGRFHVRCKPVRNARSYEVEAHTASTEEWTSYGTHSSSRLVVEGLTPGLVYTVRMRAVGAAGPGGWSDPVSAMAV